MIMSLKQRKTKFEPRIKLNHNIYTVLKFSDCMLVLTSLWKGLKKIHENQQPEYSLLCFTFRSGKNVPALC